ncbi:Neuropeptide FF receptor 2 [Acropora cervicornis]|uniref:Neuropeptide FF receptor 2 n=1 Tax=Acropora cervicornis TaxID=6130 RepID=A0AAD9QKP4_ACRCE|nr:Neuropeptide FF receptor 2 [Acropora cervicornis]
MMMATDLQSRSVYLVVVEVSSLIVLSLLSLKGNTLGCISVHRNTPLRTTTNLYITALAISDLLSAVFVMPLTIGVLHLEMACIESPELGQLQRKFEVEVKNTAELPQRRQGFSCLLFNDS